jgi:hypothetical protein
MIRWIRSIRILLCLLCPVVLQAQENLLDYTHSIRFARYLNATRQYDFAAEEYERLHYFHPEDSIVLLELVRNYRQGGKCDRLQGSFQMLEKGSLLLNPVYTREYLNFCLTCGLEDPVYPQLVSRLQDTEESFYGLSYYWRTRQFDSAFIYNRMKSEILEGSYPSLHSLTHDFEHQKYKSPALALIMSAILPGSGKAYSKRWGDAAVSFLFIATTGYASYRAFNKKGVRSFNGWFLGGIGFSFYASNLYGSFKSARNFNREVITRYEDEASRIIHSNF